MTVDIEDQLTSGMRDQVAGLALTSDVLGQATRRHQRRVLIQRTAYAAGVFGLAGALAFATVGGAGQPVPGSGGPGVVAQAATPQMELVSAVAASEDVSYQIHVTTTFQKSYANSGKIGDTFTVDGAFDPATKTGQSRINGVVWECLIDGVRYVRPKPRSTQFVQDGKADRIAFDSYVMDGEASSSANPEQLFDVLRKAEAKITKTGERTYHFEVTTRTDDAVESSTTTFVGDVALDADNRVAKVDYKWAKQGRTKLGGKEFTRTVKTVLKLSDYGKPVTVERPTNVIVLD